MLSSMAGNTIAGLILRRIFSHNQENFTGGQSPIPAVAIIEEAQSVLGRNLEETSPFVEWVKEAPKPEDGAGRGPQLVRAAYARVEIRPGTTHYHHKFIGDTEVSTATLLPARCGQS